MINVKYVCSAFPQRLIPAKVVIDPTDMCRKNPSWVSGYMGLCQNSFFISVYFQQFQFFFHYIIITIILPIIISLIIITLINIFIFITTIYHHHLLVSSFINILVYFSYYSVVIIIFICFICYLFWYYVLAFYC